MASWFLEEAEGKLDLVVDGETKGEVTQFKKGPRFACVLVHLRCGNSEQLNINDFDDQGSEVCRGMPPQQKSTENPAVVSRTKFIERWQKYVSKDPEFNQAERSCSEDDCDQSNPESLTDEGEAADVDSEESENVRAVATTDFCSTGPQDNFLKDKCLGVFDVHIKNLTPPHPSRCVRLLDHDHVGSLTESFSKQDIGQLVILSGITTRAANFKQLQQEGGGEVEVLGGNHTRQALQSLLDQGRLESPLIKVQLYQPLTTQAALTVGYQHNIVLHEKRKPVTFMEKVRLMRHCRPAPTMSRADAVAWKDMLVNIFRMKDRRKLQANLCQHLQMAQLPEDIWKKVQKATDGKVINEKFFRPLMKLKRTEDISACLDVLIESGQEAFKKQVKSLTPKKMEREQEEDQRETDSSESTAEETSEVQKLKEERDLLKAKYDQLVIDHKSVTAELQKAKDSCNCKKATKRKASEDESPEFEKDEKVMAMWKDENGDRWLPARVVRVTNKEETVCELVESGDIYTLQNLEAAPGWLLYYADISYVDPKTNATAVQSSTYNGWSKNYRGPHYAYTAIDGDYNVAILSASQLCAHTKIRPGQWWMVDLKLPFPIQGIVVWNRRDTGSWRLRSLLITVAPTLAGVDDQDSVCAFYTGPPSPLSSNPIQINCASTMRGRYLKIAKQHDEGYLALCEIDLIVA